MTSTRVSDDVLLVQNLVGSHVGPIDIAVAPGTCAAISGPSGAGKSLLLRAIADLDPNTGDIRLGGLRRSAVAAPLWRRRVTYLAAEAGWWAETVAHHFPPDALAGAKVGAARLGLDPNIFERPLRVLSTGERQRLALLRALARKPSALLLDEPTSALDTASTAQVEGVLRDALADGLALVLVTHDPAQARRLGTHRYTMKAGRLAAARPA